MSSETNAAIGKTQSGFGVILALCLTLGLISCGNAFSNQGAPGQQISASSMPELTSALERAGPNTIITVAPGNYPALKIRGLDFAGPVTIRSVDDANPAVLEGFSIRDSSNIVLQNLAIRPPQGGNGLTRYGALIMQSSDIVIDGLSFVGPGGNRKSPYASAMMLRRSNSVTLTRSYFANFRHGVEMLDLTGSRLALNEFERLQIDAIRGGGVSDTRIENNVMTGFHPAEKDHPDGIQLWSTNQKEPGRNIVIAENLVARGRGAPTQGVFIRDTHRTLPFETIEVRRNMVLGGLFNGIAVDGARGVLVQDNSVMGRSDQKSWIRLQRVRDARSSGNIAQQFLSLDNASEPRQIGNSEVGAVDSGQAQLIRDWVANTPGFADYRGPVLRRLMAGD